MSTGNDSHPWAHLTHPHPLGPKEVTLFTPDAHTILESTENRCEKAEWYDIIVHPAKSIVFARDFEEHAKRRKIWLENLGPDSEQSPRNYSCPC